MLRKCGEGGKSCWCWEGWVVLGKITGVEMG